MHDTFLPERIGNYMRGRWRDLEAVAPGAGWSVAYHEAPSIVPVSHAARSATATVYVYPSPVEATATSIAPVERTRPSREWTHEWARGQFSVTPLPPCLSMTGRRGALSMARIEGSIFKLRISANSEAAAVHGATMLTRALLRHLYAGREH